MKASLRKQVESLLEELGHLKGAKKLKVEYERKGFLSKKELKILQRLKPKSSSQAA